MNCNPQLHPGCYGAMLDGLLMPSGFLSPEETIQ